MNEPVKYPLQCGCTGKTYSRMCAGHQAFERALQRDRMGLTLPNEMTNTVLEEKTAELVHEILKRHGFKPIELSFARGNEGVMDVTARLTPFSAFP